jgi:flagellar protein FlaD
MKLTSDRESEKQASPGPGLTPDQLKAKLSLYAGALPSTILEDLFQTLKSMALPESKVEEIIEKASRSYSGQDSSTKMDELVDKMNNLEDTLIRALKTIETKQERANMVSETDAKDYPSYSVSEPSEPAITSRSKSYDREKREEPEQEYEEEAPPALPSVPSRQRVLLADVPEEAVSNAVMLKWVEFLLETVGHQNLPEVLDYYVDIGWISERVTMKLLAYASGMVAPRGRAKEKLSTKDHLRSLLFIEKLRGKDFDQSKLTRLEREIEYTIEKRIRQD